MKPFRLNKHNKLVFPSSIFVELDFSIIADLNQLKAIIKRDFEVKAPTGTEIAERADAAKPNMGLTSWKGAKVRRGNVIIAKNYLNASEMEGLNRIVNMYLDYAEDQAKRHQQVFMRDWRRKLDAFLQSHDVKRASLPADVGKNAAVVFTCVSADADLLDVV